MPIKRFAHSLERDGKLADYLGLLVNHFNPKTVDRVMCRETLSVSWDGRLFDCDFNQMAEVPLPGPERTIWDLASIGNLEGRDIATRPYCFGCTAGAGSSCGGTLV